jgi:hypothetical protein
MAQADREAMMLLKVWLFELVDGLRSPFRYGPYETQEARRAAVAEFREARPGIRLLEVDAYADGSVHMTTPTTEAW